MGAAQAAAIAPSGMEIGASAPVSGQISLPGAAVRAVASSNGSPAMTLLGGYAELKAGCCPRGLGGILASAARPAVVAISAKPQTRMRTNKAVIRQTV